MLIKIINNHWNIDNTNNNNFNKITINLIFYYNKKKIKSF